MKKLNYMGMGLLLCLSAAVWSGCDKEKEESGTPSGVSSYGDFWGVVTDSSTGEPVQLARVELQPLGLQTMTDSEGQYEFNDLEPGKYNVYVTKECYADFLGEKAAVRSDHRTRCDVRMVKLWVPEAVGSDYEETALGMSLQMVAVQGGTFEMGATEEQGDDARDDEKPVHAVTLDGFYIGKFEVTQAQWATVMGTSLSDIISDGWSSYGLGDAYPMYYVSWEEAQAFCAKLSALTGKTYRLPTEAEWEYAARGGQQADGTKYAGSNSIDDVAWYYDNSYGLGASHPDYGTHPVGQKRPNGLGLYDMNGNVWEWCSDWYGDYSSSPSVNPQGPSSGSYRVLRGGGWGSGAQNCRVSGRFSYAPVRDINLGFRVVCER